MLRAVESSLDALAPTVARLTADYDIRVEGAVRNAGWIVGASGAQPWYDHAIATMAIELFEAALARARSGQGDTS